MAVYLQKLLRRPSHLIVRLFASDSVHSSDDEKKQQEAMVEKEEPTPRADDSNEAVAAKKQRKLFDTSKTYKSLTMPLKKSRLANPFPEPVKLMPSQQVSDQEKAQRMLSEAQLPTAAEEPGTKSDKSDK